MLAVFLPRFCDPSRRGFAADENIGIPLGGSAVAQATLAAGYGRPQALGHARADRFDSPDHLPHPLTAFTAYLPDRLLMG